MQLATLLHVLIASGASLQQSFLVGVILNYFYIHAFFKELQLVMVWQQLINEDLLQPTTRMPELTAAHLPSIVP